MAINGGASGYIPNIYHPDVIRSSLEKIVATCDVMSTAGPGRTVLVVTADDWLFDELAACGSDLAHRKHDLGEDELDSRRRTSPACRRLSDESAAEQLQQAASHRLGAFGEPPCLGELACRDPRHVLRSHDDGQ
jgi:hypothetical protein